VTARSQDVKLRQGNDQLAIEGKDSQLADLRAWIERNMAAALSDPAFRVRNMSYSTARCFPWRCHVRP
jgi:hypothetical protein